MKKRNFSIHYGWLILAIGVLGIFCAIGLGRFGYATILPNMQAGLKIDNGEAGLLTAMGLIGYLAFSTIGGALASRYGGRLVVSLGLLGVGLGMVFMGLSDKFIWVAFWSLLVGVGGGAVFISVYGLFPAWFAKKRRGLASGIAITGGSLAVIVTGFIVPILINGFGDDAWKISWVLFGVIALVVGILAALILRNNPAEKGLKPIGEAEITPPAIKAVPDWKSVYSLPQIWILGLIYALYGFVYIIFMTYFVTHLVADPGFTEGEAARLFMIMGWISLLSGLIWGLVSDYIGRKKTLVILYLLHGFSFGFFGLGTSPMFFFLAAFLYGISHGSIPAMMAAICGDILGPELAPTGFGFITLIFGIGQVLGPVIAGLIADAQGSFALVFIITSFVALAGAVMTFFMVRDPEYCAK